MPEFYRVKSNETGHEFTTAHLHDGVTVLDKPAIRDGRPARAKPNQSVGRRSRTATPNDKETAS